MEFTLETVVFYFLAAFISVMCILTVTTQRIVRSATYLLFVLFGTAGMFSILLTSGEGDRAEKLKRSKFIAGLGTTIVGAIIVLFITLSHRFVSVSNPEPIEITIKTIGHALLSGDKYGYILPFEAVSILLLACIVGGLLIARKR